ncbi:hypothetical protein JCM10908_004429 [Rhodotorula pacifica]|uniref:uncharacterized protein n=1 Tax=Rhodotorula pacifica TaxID=1495444 RepID=UPI003179C18A
MARSDTPTKSLEEAPRDVEKEVEVGVHGAEVNEELARAEGIDAHFMAKAQVINQSLEECGMGRFQWELFMSAGFGYFSDNIWLQSIAIIMPYVAIEDHFPNYPKIRMATFALYMGLIPGALLWGMTADVIGRRIAWNSTLFISAVFGLAAGASPNFYVLCVMLALNGVGTAGNMVLDGAVFLEFIPNTHKYLLTLLSVWWAVGQVVASLICWAFIAKYSCDTTLVGIDGYRCDRNTNPGWRYSMYTLGAMMLFLWGLRFFILPMHESPKFLVSIGQDEEAVRVIHAVAKKNGRTSTLTVERLRVAAEPYYSKYGDRAPSTTKFSSFELAKRSFSHFSLDHIKGLFATPRLAFSSGLIIFIYAALGLAYPLFNGFLGGYLQSKGAERGDTSVNATYSSYTYQAACGIIGSILATGLVEWGRGGRKFAGAFFTIGAGAFLFGLTSVRSASAVNALTCMASLFENAFYGVIYAIAPETFPTPHRGTGDALAGSASRLLGAVAPLVATYSAAAKTPNGPVYASASIFMVAGISMLFLPIETRGRQSL